MTKRLEVAWHEAGHALVAHLIGRRIVYLWVAEDGSDGTHRPEGPPADTQHPYLRLAEEALAGSIAQSLHRLGPGTSDSDIYDDVERILSTEARNDEADISNIFYAMKTDSRQKQLMKRECFERVLFTLRSPAAYSALAELANALSAVSPAKLDGGTALQVLTRNVLNSFT